MPAPLIICPQCRTPVFRDDRCSNPGCTWQRPLRPGECGTTAWSVSLGSPLGDQIIVPAAGAGLLVFPTAEGALKTLHSRDGAAGWQYRLPPNRLARRVCASDFGFVAASEDARTLVPDDVAAEFLLLDPRRGTALWNWKAPARQLSMPAVHESTAAVVGSDHVLYAFDLAQRRLDWKTSLGSQVGWSAAAPLIAGSTILVAGVGFGSPSRILVILNEKKRPPIILPEGLHFPIDAGVGLAASVTAINRLILIDIATGETVWETLAERSFTTRPVCIDEMLYIGARDGSHAHAVYAYSLLERKRLWRYETSGVVYVPPLVFGNTLFLCDEKCRIHAVDRFSGQLLWRYDLKDYPRSIPLYVDGMLVVGSRSGEVTAIYTEACEGERWDLEPPEDYAAKGEWEFAAVSYALRGDYAHAGECYAAAGLLTEAAVMVREAKDIDQTIEYAMAAGQIDLVAPLLRQMNDTERLADLYRQAGDHRRAAQELEDAGYDGLAALEWEAENEHLRAANSYLKAKDKRNFIRLSRAIRLTPELKRILIQVSRQSETDLKADAAQALEASGYWKEALALYREAGLTAEAVRAAEHLGKWALVAEMAPAVGQHERAGEAFERLERRSEAAAQYLLAAQGLEQSLAPGEFSTRVADLYHHAYRCTKDAAGDVHRLAALAERRDFHRQSPRLEASFGLAKDQYIFLTGERGILNFSIWNEGWSLARDIQVWTEADFDSQGKLLVGELAPGEVYSGQFEIRPQKEGFGLHVSLKMFIYFKDRENISPTLERKAYISLARNQQEAMDMKKRGAAAPTEGNVFFITGEKAAYIDNRGMTIDQSVDQSTHTTDSVTIGSGHGLQLSTSDERSSTSQPELQNQRNFCTRCGFPLHNFSQAQACPRCHLAVAPGDRIQPGERRQT